MTDAEPLAALPDYASFQYGIYAGGLLEQRPELPISAAELQLRAQEKLSAEAYGYVAGGAGSERTMQANLDAFERWRIVPRMLRDVSQRALATSVLQTPMPAPLMLAPVGVQSIVHPDAELAVARAAAALDLPFILSTAASHSIEQVAEAMGEGKRWYQLYWPRERDLAASFVQRAEQAGYGAIVLTLDTWFLGWRPRDLANAYLPFLKGEGVANYFSDPVFRAALEKSPEDDPGAAIGHWAYQFANPTVTWTDIEWLREQTRLPIVLKGIVHAEDARRAVDAGVDGWSCPTTAGARSTDRSARSTPCRRSARPCRASLRCCSTAACAPAPTCSRRSRSAQTRCASVARMYGASRSTARPASNTYCAACSPSWT
jgi:lactate 2-monooxygenase